MFSYQPLPLKVTCVLVTLRTFTRIELLTIAGAEFRAVSTSPAGAYTQCPPVLGSDLLTWKGVRASSLSQAFSLPLWF